MLKTSKHNSGNKFIILSHQRTGSNLLLSLLNQHDAITTWDELFNLRSTDEASLKNILLDPKLHLDHIYSSDCSSSIGFKLFYEHMSSKRLIEFYELNLPYISEQLRQRILVFKKNQDSKITEEDMKFKMQRFWEYFEEHTEIKVIHLTRRDLLKGYVSLKTARITDCWSSIYREGKNLKINLNKEELTEYLEEIASYQKTYYDFFRNHQMITIYYEDLVEDKNKVTSKILEFLDVKKYQFTETELKKQSRNPLRKTIINYDSLKESFIGTKYHQFFE